MDPCTPYGFAQFINCCLPGNSAIEWIEGQNMKTKESKFITQMDHRLNPRYKDLSPAYVQVLTKIKQGDELLLPSGYGGHQMIRA